MLCDYTIYGIKLTDYPSLATRTGKAAVSPTGGQLSCLFYAICTIAKLVPYRCGMMKHSSTPSFTNESKTGLLPARIWHMVVYAQSPYRPGICAKQAVAARRCLHKPSTLSSPYFIS